MKEEEKLRLTEEIEGLEDFMFEKEMELEELKQKLRGEE